MKVLGSNQCADGIDYDVSCIVLQVEYIYNETEKLKRLRGGAIFSYDTPYPSVNTPGILTLDMLA